MIIERSQVGALASKLHAAGKRIATTNGCYDLLHAGHVHTFAEAKKLADVLIVGVNSDESPYFRSKPGRPIVAAHDRIALVDALRMVDYAFLFDEETPIGWVKEIKPDVHVKGTDASYDIKDCVEKEAVEAGGGTVALIPKVGGVSTTAIVTRMQKGAPTRNHTGRIGAASGAATAHIDSVYHEQHIHNTTHKEMN